MTFLINLTCISLQKLTSESNLTVIAAGNLLKTGNLPHLKSVLTI